MIEYIEQTMRSSFLTIQAMPVKTAIAVRMRSLALAAKREAMKAAQAEEGHPAQMMLNYTKAKLMGRQ